MDNRSRYETAADDDWQIIFGRLQTMSDYNDILVHEYVSRNPLKGSWSNKNEITTYYVLLQSGTMKMIKRWS